MPRSIRAWPISTVSVFRLRMFLGSGLTGIRESVRVLGVRFSRYVISDGGPLNAQEAWPE
jgi:hypothetical protein